MAAANVVLPSLSNMASSPALLNEQDSSPSNEIPKVEPSLSDSESELSEPAEPPALSASSTPDQPGDETSKKSSYTEGRDGNMSEDADFDEETTIHIAKPEPQSEEDSDLSPRPAKRKAPVDDEEEYIRNNPDLYGLRRSHRARLTRQIVDESSDGASDSDIVTRPRKRLRQLSRQTSIKANSPNEFSDDDSDAYGGSKARLSKKQRRRLLQSGDNLAPTHAEVRFSTRRAAKISNYNEDDDDDMFEDDDPNAAANNYYYEEEDTRPAIDIVLNHRLRPNAASSSPTRDDYEYFIKWQGKAYYHATWETIETLSLCRSFRRLENYVKKTLSEEQRILHDPDIPPEDKEKWNLDREQYTDSLDDYKKVERVIGWRESDEGDEYYIKWKGLPYNECTWEAASLISEMAQVQIDKYLKRSSELPISDKTEANLATRSAFRRVTEQPDYIKGGKLRDFQMTGLNFLAFNWSKGKNVVLADEMGLGKTVQTVSFINWLRHSRKQQGPFIVVVPLSTMPAWADTFDFWAPDVNYVVYNGRSDAREIIKEYELLVDGNPRRPRFNVLLTTYEYVLSDAQFLSQIKWQFMAVDEAHRLKNRDSQLYEKLIEFKAPSRLLITGTPVQNNLGELSALFDFLMPGIVNIDENMDLNSEAASAKIAELTEAIKPYMLRRTKQKVESDLPPKSEKIIRVELSDIQLEYYKNILTKNYTALNQGAKGQKQSLLNIMMELKKASNHPFMFPPAEDRLVPEGARRDERLRALITSSGKMMLLDQLLTKLKRDNHRVLIFSQMVKMLDILGEYMEARGHAYQRLDGTISSGARRIAIDHFNAPESPDFCFILSTRAGGLGINLMTADTVIIFDSDWNPQADLQAMARAHRIGQTKPVSVYRLVSKETVEEEILERARNKLMLEFLTIQRGVTDKETQARRAAHVGEPGSSTEISRILKKRGQRMFEQTDNQKKLEELDLDAVLEKAEDYKVEQPDGTDADGGEEFLRSFDFVDVKVDDLSWDEIIPKEQLEEIKAEEEKRKNEEYLADVIEQNQPRKRTAAKLESREERQAKRQARQHVAESSSEDDPKSDPNRPLNEREFRYLIRAHLRYGDIDDRREEFLAEARLGGRHDSVIKTALKEVWDTSDRLVKEEHARTEALERSQNRPLTKKDRKAVLFELHGVKRINAETILDRPAEMRLLREVTSAVSDPKAFRIPEATKGAEYTCDWSFREDGMLCVGIARHGYGAWEKIRDDPDLALHDKLFLEEHRVSNKDQRKKEESNAKSPGAVHLVRRADYLLSVLKNKYMNDPAAKRAVDNHHRNNKKNGMGHKQQSMTASPAPSAHRKPIHDKNRQRAVSHGHRESMERSRTPDTRVKHEDGKKHRQESGHHHHRHRSNDHVPNGRPSEDNDSMVRLIFHDVRDSLVQIQNATKNNIPDHVARAGLLRQHLRVVGNFIRKILDDEDSVTAGLEGRLWGHVSTYWPNRGIHASDIENIYNKIATADKGEQGREANGSNA